ncbi:MAG: hypothetical protein IJI67_06910, partial [Clostridia bacterium]|nr:hypothetical protein [Clostridia bacterium]
CTHLSVRSFCDNCAAIEAVWLAPINENAVELAKKSKREAIWVRFPSGKPNILTEFAKSYLSIGLILIVTTMILFCFLSGIP